VRRLRQCLRDADAFKRALADAGTPAGSPLFAKCDAVMRLLARKLEAEEDELYDE
jgi:hypothetical protein